MGDFREPSAPITEELPLLSPSTSALNPNPSSIGSERWAIAEEATQKIIYKVQPTTVSEERRRDVIDYVRRLIRGCLGCEVFPYGSVPLKTYLPDGDIDLTAFGGANVEDALAGDMVSILEREDQNRAAEFVVKDVQLIRAEVRLVKCIVQNIVVDISFNQIGGLCTLCFLEQVDRLIGKDHLLKRSIILIKSWCYYESRILGAHHGLISTYALETLVLYIFHFFHSTLDGPLAVLYKFLDYFSKFDWDNYCISLHGPVPVSSLPEIAAVTPENGRGDLLLSNDFLKYCVDMFSVPSKGVDVTSRTFPQKHLNIVDPLKENNNLGRSVSKGNFYRIRSAFTYGARKLGRILLQPEDKIVDELNNFFSNTLDRHGRGQRPDVEDPVPMSSPCGFSPPFSVSETKSCQDESTSTELKSTNDVDSNGYCKVDGSSLDGDNNVKLAVLEMKFNKTLGGTQINPEETSNSAVESQSYGSVEETAHLRYRCAGDAKDLATSRIQGLKNANHSPIVSCQASDYGLSPLGTPNHAPRHSFSNSALGNGEIEHEDSNKRQPEICRLAEDKAFFGKMEAPGGTEAVSLGQDKNLLIGNHEVVIPVGTKDVPVRQISVTCSEDSNHLYCGSASSGNLEFRNSDLNGDYDSHFNSLQYGRWCYEYALGISNLPMPPPLASQYQRNYSWDAIMHSSHFKRDGPSHVTSNGIIHPNGVIPSTTFYHVNPLLIPGTAFDEMPRPRGTGTYFPNTNWLPQGYRTSVVKGRNQARSPRNNSRGVEASMPERSRHEQSQLQIPVDHVGGKPGSSGIHSPGKRMNSNVNSFTTQYGGSVEFGLDGCTQLGAPFIESDRQARPAASSINQSSVEGLLTPRMQRPKPILAMDQDRVMAKSSYHLKDEDDFPPLSV